MTRSFKAILFLALGLLMAGVVACSAEEAATEPPAEGNGSAVGARAETGVETRTGTDTGANRVRITRPVATPLPAPAVVPGSSETHTNDGNGPQRGGRLVLATMADYPHRDVHQGYQETMTTLAPGLAYSRLLRLDTGAGLEQPNLVLECDLCESWELTPEMSYVFHLRPEVYWHRAWPVEGRQLVADDLAFSYERMRTPGWPGEARFADRGIGEITALDARTLEVKLEFRDADALLALADGHSKIVAPEVVERYGDLRMAPVIGTGPWIFEQTTSEGFTDYNRNPDYYEAGLPYLDGMTVKAVKAPGPEGSLNSKRLALFRAGQIDVIVAPPTDWVYLEQSKDEFNSRISHQPEIGMVMALNTQAAPLDNLAVRRAIFRAVDPWEYVDVGWAGQGGVGLGMPLPESYWQLERGEMLANYLGSHSGARDILADNEIFYPPALEITVANLGPDYRRVAVQAAQDLESVGFETTVKLVKPAQLRDAMFGAEGTYQIALAPVPPHPTTNGYLYSALHSGGPGNIVNHQDQALDTLIERQAAELDPEQRREKLLVLQRHVLEQAYMFSPITGSYRWVFDWDLENFYPNTALSENHYWAEAWLRQ